LPALICRLLLRSCAATASLCDWPSRMLTSRVLRSGASAIDSGGCRETVAVASERQENRALVGQEEYPRQSGHRRYFGKGSLAHQAPYIRENQQRSETTLDKNDSQRYGHAPLQWAHISR